MESLFRLFPEVENDQAQIASTPSFFMTCGFSQFLLTKTTPFGSPPNSSKTTNKEWINIAKHKHNYDTHFEPSQCLLSRN
jgi:hypothetical protein